MHATYCCGIREGIETGIWKAVADGQPCLLLCGKLMNSELLLVIPRALLFLINSSRSAE